MTVLPTDLADLVDRTLTRQPAPIANALVALQAATAPHDQRDRMVMVFRALVRVLGGLSLAARIQAGPGPKDPSKEVDDKLSRLRAHALTDGEWVGLTRELLRPWREVADQHPTPELVRLFFKQSGFRAGVDQLLGMRKNDTIAHGAASDSAEVRAIIEKRAPQLCEVLEGATALWESLRFVVPLERPDEATNHRQHGWLLHGPTTQGGKWRVIELGAGLRLEPGKPLVVARDGGLLRLRLEPAIVFDHASPELPADLFFLDGRAKAEALFVSFPSMHTRRRGEVLEVLDRLLVEPGGADHLQPASSLRPFRGLASFRAQDSEFFVGREKLVEELSNRITTSAWVTVTGASGSGKTSLLAAGVGPELESRAKRERDEASQSSLTKLRYVVVSMRPGAQPTRELRRSLIEALAGLDLDGDRWAQQLLDWATARRQVLVLIVDQAEELFTLCSNAAERERFGDLLGELAGSDTSPVRVVLSVRVDFMAQLATISSIGDRHQRATQVVVTPGKRELLRILHEPAERCGVHWEEGLAEEIVEAVQDQPAALALMSFVADRLWELRDGEPAMLRRQAYESLGRVEGALGAHADEVLGRFTPSQREVVRSVVLRLITTDETRAVVDRSELEEVGGEIVLTLLAQLVDARLLTAHESEAGVPRIELAHEALLVHWPQLVAWRDEDREAEVQYARLRSATRNWKEQGETADLLWPERLLTAHRSITKRRASPLTVDERRFVEESQAVADARRAAEVAAERRLSDALNEAEAQARRAKARALVAAGLAHPDEVAGTVLMRAGADLDESARQFAEIHGRLLVRESRPVYRVLEAHWTGPMEYSPDGTTVLTGSADGSARLWDPNTGVELAFLHGHEDEIWSAAFSPDGTRVLTGSQDGTARLWDIREGTTITVLRLGCCVCRVKYSPDGTAVLTCELDGTVRVWDLRTGSGSVVSKAESDGSFSTLVGYSPDGSSVFIGGAASNTVRILDARTGVERVTLNGHTDFVLSLAFSPDGRTVLTGSRDGTARLWDPRTGVACRALVHAKDVWVARFSPDGNELLTAASDGTAGLWGHAADHARTILRGHRDEITNAEYSPDGESVVTGSRDGTARLWDVRTGTERAVLRMPEGGHVAVAYSPDGTSVLTGSRGVLRLWDTRAGSERPTRFVFARMGSAGTLSGTEHVDLGEGSVKGVSFSPDSESVIASWWSGTTRLWDAQTGAARKVLPQHQGSVTAVACSPDGTKVLTGLTDGTARIQDTTTGIETAAFDCQGGTVVSVAFTPDGTCVLTATDEGWVHLWDLDTGAVRLRLSHEKRAATSVAFAPDGTTVCAGLTDGKAVVWDSRSGVVVAVLQGHKRRVTSVAYAPHGASLVTGSSDGTARVWEPEREFGGTTFVTRVVLDADRGEVTAVGYSPDGTTVATASSDGTVRIWDVRMGVVLAVLDGHKRSVTSVAYSPDGRFMLTGASDGTARLWVATPRPLATRTNIRVCEDTSAVVAVPVPRESTAYATFLESLRAPPECCAETVATDAHP